MITKWFWAKKEHCIKIAWIIEDEKSTRECEWAGKWWFCDGNGWCGFIALKNTKWLITVTYFGTKISLQHHDQTLQSIHSFILSEIFSVAWRCCHIRTWNHFKTSILHTKMSIFLKILFISLIYRHQITRNHRRSFGLLVHKFTLLKILLVQYLFYFISRSAIPTNHWFIIFHNYAWEIYCEKSSESFFNAQLSIFFLPGILYFAQIVEPKGETECKKGNRKQIYINSYIQTILFW